MMSFLSCIGKKSKKKKIAKNEPLDRKLSEISESKKEIIEELKEGQDETASHKSTSSRKSGSSLSKKKSIQENEQILADNKRLQLELDAITVENKLYKTQLDRQEDNISTYLEEIKRLETANVDLKTKITIVETEAAKTTIENQKLLKRIVGMEENQAMMSRAELQSMIAQLEEAEKKTCMKPATELSGIKTNLQKTRKKTAMTQEDRQLSWRLTKTEARLSQSEDENKRLREDLKEMLDSNTELQQIIVSEDTAYCQTQKTQYIPSTFSSGANRRVSVSTETESDSDSDVTQNTLVDRLSLAEKDQTQLRQEYDNLEKAYHKLLSRIIESENSFEQLKASQSDNSVTIEETITTSQMNEADLDGNSRNVEHLLKLVENQEKEQKVLRDNIEGLECTCREISDRIDALYAENKQVKAKNDNLIKQNKDQKNEIERKAKEVELLKNELNKAKNETKRLADELERIREFDRKDKETTGVKHKPVEISKLEQDFADLKQKYEDANKRLKEYSVSRPVQMTKSLDLNLITPVTLAERFRHELYEQHWLHAFDTLTKKLRRDEKKTQQILGEICTEAYLFCKRASRNQMETVSMSLVSPTSNHYRSNQVTKRNNTNKSVANQLPEDLKKRLLHYRCRPSEDFLKTAVSDFLNQIEYDRTRFLRHVSEREFSEIMPYVSTCFEVVWCMSVQDPPMYLLFKVKHGLEIDSETFDVYQSRGKRVDNVIWPAVFAQEGGTCLKRGVVYALPERS